MAYRIYQGLNVIFEMTGPFAKLASATERKVVAQSALREGGEWFKAERLPLRFTDWVYRNGYRVTNEWKAFKRRVLKAGRALPFIGTTPPGGGTIVSKAGGRADLMVTNAEKMAVALERGCRVDISGNSRGGDIIIRTPYGHPIRPEYADAFKKVAPEEYQLVARIVAAAFNEFLATAKMKGGRSKKLTIAGASSSWVPRTRAGVSPRDSGTVTHRKTTR